MAPLASTFFAEERRRENTEAGTRQGVNLGPWVPPLSVSQLNQFVPYIESLPQR